MDLSKLSESQLEKLMAAQGNVAMLSDDDLEGIVRSQEPTLMDKAKGFGMGALGVAGKALDYAGGVARTAGAAATMDSVNAGDVINSLLAKPLAGSDILERGGMAESGKLSDVLPGLYSDTGEGMALERGGFLDPTGRGAAGMALEVATDPLTYLTLGAAKTVGKGAEKVGESMYRSGLKRADRTLELVGKGKKGFSDTAIKYGLTGSAESIAERAQELAAKLAKEQQDILASAARAGATVDVEKVIAPVMRDASKIQSGVNIPQVKGEARGFAGNLQQLADETRVIPEQVIPEKNSLTLPGEGGPSVISAEFEPGYTIPGRAAPSVVDASRLKSQVYGLIGDNAYSTIARDKTGQKLFKRTANRLKIGVEQSVSRVNPGMGKRLKEVNKDLGSLLSSKKVLANEATKEINKNALTSVDGMLSMLNPAAAVAKKAADIFKGTAARTKGGKAVMKAGQAMQRKQANPYQFLLKEAVRQQGVQNGNKE